MSPSCCSHQTQSLNAHVEDLVTPYLNILFEVDVPSHNLQSINKRRLVMSFQKGTVWGPFPEPSELVKTYLVRKIKTSLLTRMFIYLYNSFFMTCEIIPGFFLFIYLFGTWNRIHFHKSQCIWKLLLTWHFILASYVDFHKLLHHQIFQWLDTDEELKDVFSLHSID